jgi:transposase
MKNVCDTTENVEAILAEKDSKIAKLEALVKYYEEQFRLAKHKQFGVSSEKSEYDQLSIFNEAEFMAQSTPEPELVDIEKHYRKRKNLTNDRLPEDLPVEKVEYKLSEKERTCPQCGDTMDIIGHDTRRELKIIPAQAVIVEHISETCACGSCEKNDIATPVLKAPMPQPVIKGSFASPEIVAHIMTQKFVMGIPLYRQEQELVRNGIELSRQTMSNWLLRCAGDWLVKIYNRMKILLLMQSVLHADETTLQVLHEPGKTAQSKSYMWLYRTSGDVKHPIVLYEYQPSRKALHPQNFLAEFSGYLHADGYDGYHKLPENIVVVGCWAHLRRKFDEALKSLPEKDREGTDAMRGKRYCDKLFEMERTFAELTLDERFEQRQEISRPLIEDFFAWAGSVKSVPKSPLGKAVFYAFSQRKYLEKYLLDGRLEISNNRAERSIKPFVIGRKNWLFANTVKGARASSVMYSIMETAKENGLKAYDYLTFLFKTLPNAAEQELDALLPWGYAVPNECRMPAARDEEGRV